MQSFPEANYSALRAGVTCRSLDTINPGVQISNQISLWQALWDYPWVLWARWAPGKPHCSVTVGLLLLLPAAAWLGLGEPSRLVGCRSPPHLTVRARPPQGCMARMGRCTTPPQVTVQGNGREVWITIKMMSILKLLRDDVCGVEA